jgi:hypothetical protein
MISHEHISFSSTVKPGIDKDGKEIFLRDIWPTREQIQVCLVSKSLRISLSIEHLFNMTFILLFTMLFFVVPRVGGRKKIRHPSYV